MAEPDNKSTDAKPATPAAPATPQTPAPAPTPAQVQAAQPKAGDSLADAEAKRSPEPDQPQVEAPSPREPDTVATAGVHAPVDPGMSAGDHLAQKFGNDPANPKPAPGLGEGYEGPMVMLNRKTPDATDPSGLVTTEVPEAMVGDYLRAGWNRAD